MIDVHLMIQDPDRYAPAFIEAGGNRILVHQEACRHLDRIRAEGVSPGVVINPATPVIADSVLMMSVNPRFGGQEFIPDSLHKDRQLARRKTERGLPSHIEIDSGITHENVADAIRAVVTWVVAGWSIFHSVNPGNAFEEMRQIAHEAVLVRV